MTVTVSRRSVSISVRSSIENPATSEWDVVREAGEGGGRTDAGELVNHDSTLSVPAVYQAVSAISGDVAKLPMGTYRRLEGGGRTLDRNHKLFNLISLTGQPNEETDAYQFWRRLMVSALLWSNGYAWIERNQRGEVLGLYQLLPDRTTPVRIQGRLYYLTEVKRKLEPLRADEVLHLQGLTLDGFHCPPIIRQFRELIGGALAKRRFASKFFGASMTAGGLLIVPPGKSPASAAKMENKIQERFSGAAKAFKTLVMEDGYKWEKTQVEPEKAQLHESTEHDAREVARVFNMAPSRLGVAGSTSYNSAEAAKADYHDGTLSHWLIGLRSQCNAKLRTAEEKASGDIFIDYNVNALSWADAKTRSEIANAGIMNGRFSPNETRGWENLNPYPEGDAFYTPVNLQQAGGGEASEASRGTDPRQAAAVRLAGETVTRARNRLRHKVERAKGREAEAIAEQRGAVLEMLAAAAEVLGRSADEIYEELAAEAAGKGGADEGDA